MRALIIRPGALGDTLLLAPAFYQLAGKVELSLAGRRPGIDFLRSFLFNCLDCDQKGWHRLFLGEPLCEKHLIPDVDRVVSFVSDLDGRVNRALRKSLEQIPVFSFPPFPAKGEKIHVALYLAICLKRSGLPVDPYKALEEAKTRPVISKNNSSGSENILVLHPGSGSKKKNHSPEFWIELIRNKDFERFDKRILLLGPAEEEPDRVFTSKLSGKKIEIVYSPHEDRLLSLLQKASLYIGHDSGITHLAAMLGIPTICLFKNSNPLQWAPLGPNVTVIPDSKYRGIIFRKIKEALKPL